MERAQVMTMVMERAQQNEDRAAMPIASSTWGPHAVGGAQRERSAL